MTVPAGTCWGEPVALGKAGALHPDLAAFFLDVDGTLLDIAPHPDAVHVHPDLPAVLARLQTRCSGALALVSGRSVERLDTLFHPLRLPVAGSHGAQLRLAADAPVWRAPALDPGLKAALAAVAARFGDLLVEDKGTAMAVHFRARPELGEELGAALAALVAARGEGLALLPGHFVYEVKPAGLDKGTAVDALMGQPAFAGRLPVFIGDDVTDQAGFRAATARGGLAISVGRPLPGAQHVLDDPQAVRVMLARLAHLQQQQGS